MAQDDAVAVQGPGTTVPGPTAFIKTIDIAVRNAAGQIIAVQAVALVDETGAIQVPMTETTGREILAALISINNTLVETYQCGARIEPGTPA